MLKIGDKIKSIKDIEVASKKYLTKGKTYTVVNVKNEIITFVNDLGNFDETFSVNFEKVEDNMEKSFREVIRDIKEGEVWEVDGGFSTISKTHNGNIKLEFEKEQTKIKSIIIDTMIKYILQRKQYTFTEAFKAYEEGKEIESCESGNKWGEEVACFNTIAIKDIQGKWYINN